MGEPSRKPQRRQRILIASAAGASVLAGAFALILVLGAWPRSDAPRPRPLIPSVIGLTAVQAEARLNGAGFTMERIPEEVADAGDGVLRQMPAAGWEDLAGGIVRVSFVSRAGDARVQASAVSSAISGALAQFTGEGHGPGVVIEVEPFQSEIDKDAHLAARDAVVIQVNGDDGGAEVLVEARNGGRVVSFTWRPDGQWVPDSLRTSEELIALALAVPPVADALAGQPVHAEVLDGSGPAGSPSASRDIGPDARVCVLPNGFTTCRIVWIPVGTGEAGLVYVNYVTMQASVLRMPAI